VGSKTVKTSVVPLDEMSVGPEVTPMLYCVPARHDVPVGGAGVAFAYPDAFAGAVGPGWAPPATGVAVGTGVPVGTELGPDVAFAVAVAVAVAAAVGVGVALGDVPPVPVPPVPVPLDPVPVEGNEPPVEVPPPQPVMNAAKRPVEMIPTTRRFMKGSLLDGCEGRLRSMLRQLS
jgi:hypothetical protein